MLVTSLARIHHQPPTAPADSAPTTARTRLADLDVFQYAFIRLASVRTPVDTDSTGSLRVLVMDPG